VLEIDAPGPSLASILSAYSRLVGFNGLVPAARPYGFPHVLLGRYLVVVDFGPGFGAAIGARCHGRDSIGPAVDSRSRLA
jgi:hypothetical protein